jgi:hypothetical protein
MTLTRFHRAPATPADQTGHGQARRTTPRPGTHPRADFSLMGPNGTGTADPVMGRPYGGGSAPVMGRSGTGASAPVMGAGYAGDATPVMGGASPDVTGVMSPRR